MRMFLRIAVGLLCVLMPQAAAQLAGKVALSPDVMDLGIRFAGKNTTAAKVDAKLSPAERQALNDWAAFATKHAFEIVVPQKTDALVMGRARMDQLLQAATVMEQASAIFDGCKPAAEARPGRAVLVVLFDKEGFASEAWPALLNELVARNVIQADFAQRMKSSPGAFTARGSSIFVQHTYDMVGDAAAGDDEFRFSSEIAHKSAQYLIEARFGRQPDVLRWGVGYVAEQRLYGHAFQFSSSGFVAVKDHYGWPEKTRELLLNRSKFPDFKLADAILATPEPGTADFGQQLAWGTLDYQLTKEPKLLADLLGQLGALDRAADPDARSLEWRDDEKKMRETCATAWAKLKPATLAGHLKGLKSEAAPMEWGGDD